MKKNNNLMKKFRLIGLLVLLCAVKGSAQTTFTVTSVNDVLVGPPAPGTIRWAFDGATTETGLSIIQFNIPGTGPFIFSIKRTLPVIQNKTIYIDGTTQPGYNFADPATPMIILDGGSTVDIGVALNTSNGSKVIGLGIKKFTTIGFKLTASANCEIINNVICQNGGYSFDMTTSSFCLIKGNYINVDKTLVQLSPNSSEGFFIHSSNDNTFGGTNCGEGNTIGFVGSEGIDNISSQGQRNRYSGNRIFGCSINEIYLRVTGNAGKAAPVINTTGCTTSGTSGRNNIIEIFGSSGPASNNRNALVYMGTTKANAIGAWSLPLSNITYPYVTATATDSVNNTSELAVSKAIVTDPLVMSIKKPNPVCAKEKITYELGTMKCLKALSFVWNFGDGTTPSDSPEHTYAAPGTYTITVSAYEKNNCQPLTTSLPVTVTTCAEYDCNPCTIIASTAGPGAMYPNHGTFPDYYQWDALPSSGTYPYTYLWYNPSGNIGIVGSATGSSVNTSFPGFSAACSISVKITDAAGCSVVKTLSYDPN
jgi:hypothetical protein